MAAERASDSVRLSASKSVDGPRPLLTHSDGTGEVCAPRCYVSDSSISKDTAETKKCTPRVSEG